MAWSLLLPTLAVCVMLPRLASPEFGLLDDGFTLRTGRELAGHWWSALHLIPDTGRFFPAYWVAHAALLRVLGPRPLAWFGVNTLLLAALIAILMRLVTLGGGARRDAAVAALLFASSGPAIEAFYTLSKPEPLQLLWIAISLLVTAAAVRERRAVRRAALTAAAAGALLIADATKETGVALVPISLGWLALEHWWLRERGVALAFARTYAGLAIVAAVAFGALRSQFAPLALGEGWYTRAYSVHAQTIGAAAFRICAWLLRDFTHLLPLAAAAIAIASIVRRARTGTRRVVPYACIWMAGWLAVYLPWPVTFEYYLLPFALGAAALGAVLIGDALDAILRARGWRAALVPSCVLAVAGLSWTIAAVNAASDARVQLAVDRANADLVAFLGTLPQRSRVAVNTPWLNEYVSELRLHLAELERRPDLVVQHLPALRPGAAPIGDVFVATPAIAGAPAPTVRIPLDEPGVRRVNAIVDTILDGRGDLVYRTGERARVLELGVHRLLCRVARKPVLDPTFCPPDRPVFRARAFQYGWRVHRVRTLVPRPG